MKDLDRVKRRLSEIISEKGEIGKRMEQAKSQHEKHQYYMDFEAILHEQYKLQDKLRQHSI